MGFDEVRRRLKSDPEAAARIERYLEENYRAVALADLRQAGRVTQAELAGVLGVSQRRVSAIEHASDVQVSTLRDYLGKLGYELELTARSADGDVIPISLQGEVPAR